MHWLSLSIVAPGSLFAFALTCDLFFAHAFCLRVCICAPHFLFRAQTQVFFRVCAAGAGQTKMQLLSASYEGQTKVDSLRMTCDVGQTKVGL